jgi:hypothetical protein
MVLRLRSPLSSLRQITLQFLLFPEPIVHICLNTESYTYSAEFCACTFSQYYSLFRLLKIFHTAVTTLGDSSLLLDVEVSESATGGLDDADLVGLCRVADICVRLRAAQWVLENSYAERLR